MTKPLQYITIILFALAPVFFGCNSAPSKVTVIHDTIHVPDMKVFVDSQLMETSGDLVADTSYRNAYLKYRGYIIARFIKGANKLETFSASSRKPKKRYKLPLDHLPVNKDSLVFSFVDTLLVDSIRVTGSIMTTFNVYYSIKGMFSFVENICPIIAGTEDGARKMFYFTHDSTTHHINHIEAEGMYNNNGEIKQRN